MQETAQPSEEKISESAIASELIAQAEVTSIDKLKSMLKVLGIDEVIYIDDYNNLNSLPIVLTTSKSLFLKSQFEDLNAIFDGQINLQVPSEEELGQEINNYWDGITPEDQEKIFSSIVNLGSEGFSKQDYNKTRELGSNFPDYIKLINPDEWDTTLQTLIDKYNDTSKVLILFDQDLSNANGSRFRSSGTKGEDLILEIKRSPIGGNVICALISHLIENIAGELTFRNQIINGGGGLTKHDFLALSKNRISNAELFCDGIKKTLLNTFFEVLKDASKAIIGAAQEESLKRFEQLDTFDFDHTILRSSFTEGVWEANTIFRITTNFLEEEVKKLMISDGYAKKINPSIKTSKQISDFSFRVPDLSPYREKYKLRHDDLYEAGTYINQLHTPIENGDIFEVYDGSSKGKYILIGQECDLMMRNTGSRSSKNTIATLVKIATFEIDTLKSKLLDSNHYFANKFRLDYFESGTSKVGVAQFLNFTNIDLNILDLCVFNVNGDAILDLNNLNMDTELLSTSWEKRFNIMSTNCRTEADKLDLLIPEVNKLSKVIRDPILKKIYPNLGVSSQIGTAISYNGRIYKFGIKRVMRLKNFGANYLIDRYYKHLARTAEPHDFAVE